MSRASSVSLRDKNNGGKKMRRRRDSDTFETRANYVAYAPAYGPSHQPTWVQPQYVSANAQFNGPVQQQQYPAPVPSIYGAPNSTYPPMAPGGGYGPQYNNVPNVSLCFWWTSFYIAPNWTDMYLVLSASWTTTVPTSYDLDVSGDLWCPCAVLTSTATRLAAATATTSRVQPKPLPISSHSGDASRNTLCFWRPPG